MAEGNLCSQSRDTEDGFEAQAMRNMADVLTCIPDKSHWKQG